MTREFEIIASQILADRKRTRKNELVIGVDRGKLPEEKHHRYFVGVMEYEDNNHLNPLSILYSQKVGRKHFVIFGYNIISMGNSSTMPLEVAHTDREAESFLEEKAMETARSMYNTFTEVSSQKRRTVKIKLRGRISDLE